MNKVDIPNWKKFKVSDLFAVKTGDVDLQQKDVNGKGIALVSSGEANAGVIGLTDAKAKIISKSTITVDMFGSVHYRDFPYKMVTHARVFALIPNAPINQETGLYLASVLQKQTTMYSYNNMCSWNKIKSLELLLPVTPQSTPDWDYMQEYIAKLEQEYIAELEQYLIATGLNDYTLTDEDLKILSSAAPRKGGERAGDARVRKEMREFAVDKLFELRKVTRTLSKLDLLTIGEYPVYSSDTRNNGIIGYIDNPEFICDEKTPVYITFGDHTRTLNIARKSFSVLDNVKVLIPCVDNDEVLLYLVTAWKKGIQNFGYARHWKIARECDISLPIQTDPSNHPIIDPAHTYHPEGFIPDWDYMAAHIRAIEKLVIKDIVDFKDEFIAKTRGVVK